MSVTNETSFKQRMGYLKESLSKENNEIADNLNEKGVECAILIPLLEHIWGFDALMDVKYEFTSDKRYDRFDFLVDNRILIEAKKVNASLNDSVVAQIEKYIKNHDFIQYGVLTNGATYIFFVKKSFVREFLGPEEKFRIEYDQDIFKVLELNIEDEKFYDLMHIFNKNVYHESFKLISKYVLTLINKTRPTKILDDKELNVLLQNMIAGVVDAKEGILLKDIQNGKLQVNQIIKYENEDLCIPVVVLNDGRVKLVKNTINVKNMNNVDNSEFKPIIDLARNEWKTNDTIFNDTKDIIRAATNKQRLYGTYDFK